MIRTILSFAVLTSFVATAAMAQSSPSKSKKHSNTAPKVAPATPLKSGWSLVNGVWTHSDGYQFVKGQVVRVGTQTHQKPPAPPTKAEMDAAMKKPAVKTPAQMAADKEAERQRNLAPSRPASQTGTHL
jgi:hypothetical protein